MSRSSIPAQLREAVFARDGDAAPGAASRSSDMWPRSMSITSFPRSRGGATALDNLALQCPSCSLRKADKAEARDPATGENVRLFHPLAQAWSDHFVLEPDVTCRGTTAIGRATLTRSG